MDEYFAEKRQTELQLVASKKRYLNLRAMIRLYCANIDCCHMPGPQTVCCFFSVRNTQVLPLSLLRSLPVYSFSGKGFGPTVRGCFVSELRLSRKRGGYGRQQLVLVYCFPAKVRAGFSWGSICRHLSNGHSVCGSVTRHGRRIRYAFCTSIH